MGQQQLLLVILVTIIVGIATVVAINVFGNSQEANNYDAARIDMLQIAAGSQSYAIKPVALGGGGQNLTNISFLSIPWTPDSVNNTGLNAQNLNAVYVISGRGVSEYILTAHPVSTVTGVPNLSSTSSNPISIRVFRDGIEWIDTN